MCHLIVILPLIASFFSCAFIFMSHGVHVVVLDSNKKAGVKI